VIEVGVRCFESIPVFLAFSTAHQDLAFHQTGWRELGVRRRVLRMRRPRKTTTIL